MTKTEELIKRAQQGDKTASETLVTENAGLIWSVARRFLGRGAEADDLYQLGCLGFIKAVDGFDLEFGTQFSTYAVPKIAGEIRRFLRDDGAVKVSRSIKEQAAAIKTARNQLAAQLGAEPTLSQIAEATGLPQRKSLWRKMPPLPPSPSIARPVRMAFPWSIFLRTRNRRKP
jgi:RNA polymerase sporulation-specific sigma factor